MKRISSSNEEMHYFHAVDADVSFSPPFQEWENTLLSNKHPQVTFNLGAQGAWEQTQKEVNYIRDKIELKDDGVEYLSTYLFGLFNAFKKVTGSHFEIYCIFMSTFF